MAAVAPSGTVTFLFTDVVGSTRLWAADRRAMAASLEVHDRVMRAAIEGAGGVVFTTAGDSFSAAFERASSAVRAAVAAQVELAAAVWPGPVLTVRMGLHLGEPDQRDGDYFGPVVNTTARVSAVGHGGQVLFTEPVRVAAEIDGLDLGEHTLRDVGPVRIFQIGDEVFPALRSVDRVVSSLPVMRSSLIGRDAELVEVGGLLTQHRLVTVTGVGGCGKTRLVVELMARETGAFEFVFFVDLAPVDEADAVANTFAAGVVVTVHDDPLDAVASLIGRRSCLLVVDNCEHLLDATADCVETLLARCPSLVVLATSREALAVDGERAWRIPSLGVDGDRSPAARLFLERADLADDALSDEQHRVVGEICRRLDGIPLAIELAAARAASMPLAEIHSHLDERFRLLSGGRRRAQQRHRTLQSMVEWSHDLLSDDERVLLRRLSVFVDGFDITDVGPVTGFAEYEAFVLVDALVAKSLIDVQRRSGDRPRLRLLETIRLYAQDRLVEAGEADWTRNAHLDHFLTRMVRYPLVDYVADPDEEAVKVREAANIWAATRWAADTERTLDAALLAAHCHEALRRLEASNQGSDLIRAALEFPGLEQRVEESLLLGGFLTSVLLGDWASGVFVGRRARDLIDRGLDGPDARMALYPHVIWEQYDSPAEMSSSRRRWVDRFVEAGDNDYAVGQFTVMLSNTLLWADEIDEGVALALRADRLLGDTTRAPGGRLNAVSALAIAGRGDAATELARRPCRASGTFSDYPALIEAAAELFAERPSEPASRLARVAASAVKGNLASQYYEYMYLFAWFRYRNGESERAVELVWQSGGRFMFFLGGYLIGILEPGLTHADIGARWAGINAAIAAAGGPARAEAQVAALLAEEIAYWTSAE